jgi:hypothetical protein
VQLRRVLFRTLAIAPLNVKLPPLGIESLALLTSVQQAGST